MDLNELQSVKSRERQTDSLQQLRGSFYRDAGEYIQQLRAERDSHAAESDDPFNDPEISRLSDDIETAEQTVEAIYERRVGKIVKMASLAAVDMPTEDDGLTEEERRLFESLVGEIEHNHDRVQAILDGDQPPEPSDWDSENTAGEKPNNRSQPSSDVAESTAPSKRQSSRDGLDRESEVSAADLMGSDDQSDQSREHPPPPDDESTTNEADGPVANRDGASSGGATSEPAHDAPDLDEPGGGSPGGPTKSASRSGAPGGSTSAEDRSTSAEDRGSTPSTDAEKSRSADGGTTTAGPEVESDATGPQRRRVRVTDDVGEIFGVEGRAYDLSAEDVVDLPEPNAEVLIDDDAAEPLD